MLDIFVNRPKVNILHWYSCGYKSTKAFEVKLFYYLKCYKST